MVLLNKRCVCVRYHYNNQTLLTQVSTVLEHFYSCRVLQFYQVVTINNCIAKYLCSNRLSLCNVSLVCLCISQQWHLCVVLVVCLIGISLWYVSAVCLWYVSAVSFWYFSVLCLRSMSECISISLFIHVCVFLSEQYVFVCIICQVCHFPVEWNLQYSCVCRSCHYTCRSHHHTDHHHCNFPWNMSRNTNGTASKNVCPIFLYFIWGSFTYKIMQ